MGSKANERRNNNNNEERINSGEHGTDVLVHRYKWSYVVEKKSGRWPQTGMIASQYVHSPHVFSSR